MYISLSRIQISEQRNQQGDSWASHVTCPALLPHWNCQAPLCRRTSQWCGGAPAFLRPSRSSSNRPLRSSLPPAVSIPSFSRPSSDFPLASGSYANYYLFLARPLVRQSLLMSLSTSPLPALWWLSESSSPGQCRLLSLSPPSERLLPSASGELVLDNAHLTSASLPIILEFNPSHEPQPVH